MIQKKPTLGRGLADLLGQSARPVGPAVAVSVNPPVSAPHAVTPVNQSAPVPAGNGSPAGEELAHIPLDLLQRGRYQPRIDMRQETLQELADSIKTQGVIQPIVVRPLSAAEMAARADGQTPVTAGSQRYEIIAGERRWRAAQLAGLTQIPAVIRRVPDEAAIAMALIENIQRENLNPLEEARALDRLISEFQLTHQQAADAVGRSRAAVSNLLRLLDLAPEVCELIEKRELEMGHARALLGLNNRRKQIEVGTLIAKKGISVRETEAVVRRMQQPASQGGNGGGGQAGNTDAEALLGSGSSDPNVRRLEEELAEKLGARVAIQHAASGKGKLVVNYNSLDELDGILAHIH